MGKKLHIFKKKPIKYSLIVVGMIALVFVSNLYLQWCQNELSFDLVFKFAFSWHTEKFILGSFVLLIFLLFLCSLAGSLALGSLLYGITIGILGFADYQKMFYRVEPIYPDDLKMITEFGLLREMIGTIPFIFILLLAVVGIFFFIRAIYQSRLLSKKMQIIRLSGLVVTIGLLMYISNFNNPNNLLRKAYDKTALWIPYSQKMNYYNTGFMGGFLYNLKIEAMDKPENYSKKTIEAITTKYTTAAERPNNSESTEQPNIIFVMSESFSNPQNLAGVTADKDPLKDYFDVAKTTYSGQMLSQNYGGGTANIEFEALTSLSMELFNPQLTTPYTMLIPKMEEMPSIVSLLKEKNYQATAIHPYNTSMYKRKDVYKILGFDQFISEDTMTYKEKLQKNPYISDKSAYNEVLDLLKDDKNPQFVHLVTMQTHMPYSDKYTSKDYSSQSVGNKKAIDSYMQDIAYSSEALKQFTTALKDLKRRTLVVFWGDHLPSIYSDEIKAANEEVQLHETEFLMYDTQDKLSQRNNHDALSSPFYFAPTLFDQSNMEMTGFYQLLSELEQEIPAFEKGFYYKNGQWSKTFNLNKAQQELYEDYRLIQYDIVSGENYSLKTDFFK
ncbi:membrane-oligosaccharide glycerophosphotransferase [Enterococcus moraviensis ATCC BAA-383]|uniref:Membrane-oligosaccharide glycerophosphotransferase n=1 Tax=Enterococcus moraviensis ATCC BAA-383 TaxID=1158609 RepID=R2R4I6_9ENTE|nr:LTA synthase family protein [Enterococcus moraviensis]EOI02701.1 membrane-oligosaccharide glycerophosphotransferase [Enterococcus moraviensis ATCC BAA-383]EOT73922.1 membrane-oligosaccharide glycerophosphotransferase [Enterococcus moraviensis ATCC BAA-383]OJG66166.1 membrane-oligosaccharide glycerophosphotransferase [Enterococcus moraviensis]